MTIRLMRLLRNSWSSSEFDAEELSRFAQPVMREDARQGIFALGMLSMLLMAGLVVLYFALELNSAYLYTFGVLALLALHVALSAKALSQATDAMVFYVLGLALLVICALAFALLAHRYSAFTATLFIGVALLFMVVPLVPWGMREAVFAVAAVYVIFTGSTLSVARRFTPEALWTLQFLMLSAAAVALALVWRGTIVRKGHLHARFDLTQTNEKLAQTALLDALTGAWNRRFLEKRYDAIVAGYAATAEGWCLAVADIDKFKQLNDTLGHAYGDRVLRRLVSIMERVLGPDEYVIRIGGDEFVLLLRGGDARERLQRTCDALERRKKRRPQAPAMPGVSIGVAKVPPGVQIPFREAYLLADEAMYAAKRDPAQPVLEMRARDKAGA